MSKESTFIGMLLKRLRHGTSPREDAQWEALLREEGREGEARDLEALWKLSGKYKSSYQPDKKKALGRFKNRLKEERRRQGRRVMIGRAAAAAAVLLLLTFMIWHVSGPMAEDAPATVFVEADSGIRSVMLPDGSSVLLNAGSHLEYQEKDGMLSGPLFLRGEAFFTVKPRQRDRFTLLTPDTEISVLGTAFNVRAFPDETFTEVEVEEGKVAFDPRNGSADGVIIEAGQKGLFRSGTLRLIENGPTLLSRAWREGSLSFRDTPMDQVALALERYYGVTLEFSDPSLSQCTYTGQDLKASEVEQTLKLIALTFSARLEHREAGSYLLKGGTCAKDN